MCCLRDCIRGQARSHIRPHSKGGTRSCVGAGLAREEALTGARNPGSDLFVQLTASHIRPHSKSRTRSTVGAGLAREEALTGARNPGSNLVTDYLPHPTAFQRWNPIKCGSGLAREEALTGAHNPGSDLFVQLTASHIRPHSKGGTRSNVGAGLAREEALTGARNPGSDLFCTADCLPHPTAFQRRNPIKCGSRACPRRGHYRRPKPRIRPFLYS